MKPAKVRKHGLEAEAALRSLRSEKDRGGGPNMDRGPIMDTFYSRQQMRPFRSKFDNETLRNVILAQFYVRNRPSLFFRGTYNACMESIDNQVFENRSKSLGKTRYVLC